MQKIVHVFTQNQTLPGDWKVTVNIDTTRDALVNRVFLRHNQFKEFPVKLSCFTRGSTQYFVTLLPNHPSVQKHVHSEKVLFSQKVVKLSNHDTKIECVDEFTDTNLLVKLDSVEIAHGSIFLRNDLDVVVSLVEKTHHETFSSGLQNVEATSKPTLSLTVQVSFPKDACVSSVRRKLNTLEEVVKWFDF